MNKTNASVLKALSNTTDYISGTKLAYKLNISRTAIWKAIKSLQAAGYDIESKARLGYILHDSDTLNPYAIKKLLPHQRLQLHMLNETTSTNSHAKQLLAHATNTDAPHVVVANNQTDGYGRYARKFESPQGGIYLTVATSIKTAAKSPGIITTLTAVVVARTIEQLCHVPTTIKWVNDVLVDNRKVAGILCEGISDMETGQLKSVIIGIGVNFKTDTNIFSQSLSQRAGSLKAAATKHSVTRNQFITTLLAHLFKLLNNLPDAAFMDEYRQRCAVINHNVTLKLTTRTISGTVSTIDDAGRLILTDGQCFSAGEIIKTRSQNLKSRL